MQIHDYICFCVTHLLRACCDYECLNFGTATNFVYNMGVYYFKMYDIFLVFVMSICPVSLAI